MVLVATVAGTAVAADPTATSSALTKKKVRKLVKKEVAKQIGNAEGPQGPPGPAGPPGPPGRDARALFAYVRDPLDGDASIGYGRGVMAVAEPADTEGRYDLTFDRSVRNCVGQANTGLGDPLGGNAMSNNAGIASVSLIETPQNQLTVRVWHSGTESFVDSSFLISVFC
jgi:hypothetical protein